MKNAELRKKKEANCWYMFAGGSISTMIMNDGLYDCDDENIDESEKERRLIESLEKLTQVEDVQNSALKMGYNEEDYVVTRTEKPNCIHEFIAPRDFVR